jgi:predicted outer membrane repeat protein
MDSNYAYEFGGGCNLEVGGSVIINNTVFSRNRAGSSGGGIRARERLDLSTMLFDKVSLLTVHDYIMLASSLYLVSISMMADAAHLLRTESANSPSNVQNTTSVLTLLQLTV